MPNPRTIQIFLPEGEPRGIRVAGFSNRVVKAVAFPRSKFAEACKRDDLSKVGVYFLFGAPEGAERPSVYVGEAECCADRLSTHNADAEMDFWQVGITVVSDSLSFTKAHVKMLEWASIRKAKEAGRYVVENGNSGSKPHLPEPMLAEVNEVLEDLDVLLGSLGYPIFEPVSTSPGKGDGGGGLPIFSFRGKNFAGRLVYSPDGFVVLKGSVARLDVTESSRDGLVEDRDRLAKQGIIELKNDGFHFVQDHVFNSASAAAEMIAGRTSNGWDCWVDDKGRTLHSVYRAPEQAEAAANSAVLNGAVLNGAGA